MTKFEDLPGNIRALMLAKLAMEMKAYHCANFYELATKRRTDTMNLWRSICRSAGQPICTIPQQIVQPHWQQNSA